MKILFISDIADWSYFEYVLSKEHPSILLIGGDIFQNVNNTVNEKLQGILFRTIRNPSQETLHERWHFLRNVSIVRFYLALQYAGRQCQVFVVKGDHDLTSVEPNSNTCTIFGSCPYDHEKIDAMVNCREISGKTTFIDGLQLLGLGYLETHYLRKLRSIAASQRTYPDIVLAHSENRRREMICRLFKPRLLLTGHCGFGKRKLGDTWIVESCCFPLQYATIEVEGKTIHVSMKYFCSIKHKFVDDTEFHCLEKGFPWCDKCHEYYVFKYGEIKNMNLLRLANRLEKAFPTLVEISKDQSYILVMGKTKITERGVVEGEGPVAERVQEIYEKFVKEAS